MRIELRFLAVGIHFPIREQRQSELHRILFGGMREFVDEALHYESIEGVRYGAPPGAWNAGCRGSVLQLDIGNRIGQIDRAFDLLPL